eukprot:10869388-Karenia_brevis.AAC.1
MSFQKQFEVHALSSSRSAEANGTSHETSRSAQDSKRNGNEKDGTVHDASRSAQDNKTNPIALRMDRTASLAMQLAEASA